MQAGFAGPNRGIELIRNEIVEGMGFFLVQFFIIIIIIILTMIVMGFIFITWCKLPKSLTILSSMFADRIRM